MNKELVWTFVLGVFATTLLFGVSANASEKSFKKCASCHSIEEGGKNKTGPNLWNVMNRGVAADESYKYSKALTKWAEENPVWTPELMDEWLTNSKKLVKGTKMGFKEKKEKNRADIIEYLQKMGVQPE